jgi:hypothetical protein
VTLQIVPSEPARPAFPTVAPAEDLADRIDRTHPAIVLPQQLLLSQERAAWLGDELRAQVAREGIAGIVGRAYTMTVDGEKVQTGEYARVLVDAEHRERVHAASLAERIARLGLESRSLQGDTARSMVGAIRALLAELGVRENDDSLHAARRAGLVGRRAAGCDDGDPDVLIGPRLSAEARVRVLREALAAAEREAGMTAEHA